MAKNFESGLQVDGAFRAGNVAFGNITLSPTATNSITTASVSGLSLTGTGDLHPIVTPLTRVPGTTVKEVCVNNVSSSGFDVLMYRTTQTDTVVQWMAWRRTDDLDAPPPDPGGGGDPPTVERITKTYTPTWSATWDDYGKFSSANAMYQGRYSAGAGGYEYSKWGFNYTQIQSDLAGSTIVSVKWRMKNLHSYYGSGLTVMLGLHNNASEPAGSSSENGTPGQHSYTQSKGSTKEETIPNSFAEALRDNTAKGIMIGDWNSGGLNEYGYFDRTSEVRLSITYDKAV